MPTIEIPFETLSQDMHTALEQANSGAEVVLQTGGRRYLLIPTEDEGQTLPLEIDNEEEFLRLFEQGMADIRAGRCIPAEEALQSLYAYLEAYEQRC